MSWSFIYEEALHHLAALPAPGKCSFPPWLRSAERDVSLREWREDRRTEGTTRAPLVSPDGSGLENWIMYLCGWHIQRRTCQQRKYLHFLPQSASLWPCWPPRSIDWKENVENSHISITTWGFNGITCKKINKIYISLVLLHFCCLPLEWPFSQNSSPRPTSKKKKPHMCRLIYKVLTTGPKKISVVLGKRCLVYATANRCFRHAVEAGLFPPRREWKKKCSCSLLQPGTETGIYNYSAEGSDLQQQMHKQEPEHTAGVCQR